MSLAPNLLRRGASYSWRRRVPSAALRTIVRCQQKVLQRSQKFQLGNVYFQVALGTSCPRQARSLAHLLNFTSERMFTMLEQRHLTTEQKIQWVKSRTQYQTERLHQLHTISHGRKAPRDGAPLLAKTDALHNRALDRLRGHAFRLLAQHGEDVNFDIDLDDELRECNFGTAELETGQLHLDLLKQEYFKYTPGYGRFGNGRVNSLATLAEELLGLEKVDGITATELRQLELMSKAIAHLQTDCSFETRFNELLEAAKESEQTSAKAFASSVFTTNAETLSNQTPTPQVEVRNESTEAFSYSSRVSDLLEIHLSDKIDSGIENKTRNQIRQCVELFVEITGVEDFSRLQQSHIAGFADTMRKIPSNYRKSPKDKSKPIQQIIADADNSSKSVNRFSHLTINRNLGFLQGLIDSAKKRGLEIDPRIDTTSLKRKAPSNAESPRVAFSKEDVQSLFRGAPWQGCQSPTRRSSPGALVIKDEFYWLPLLAALSGARRAELAGLCRGDIIQVDDVWCFDIRPNKIRRLKNSASERRVPIHSQLIELGFIDFAKPSLAGSKPIFENFKQQKSFSEHGKEISYTFRKVVNGNITSPEKKCFHSFRHYVATTLGNNPEVSLLFKDEILGHRSPGIGNSTYYGGTEIQNLTMAIECLPRIKALEGK